MKKLSKILLAISFVLSLTTSAFATTVTAVSWGGAYTESQKLGYGDPTAKKLGINIAWVDYSGGLSEIKAQKEAGKITWDIMDVFAMDTITGCDEGLFVEFDFDKDFPPAPDGTPASKDFFTAMPSKCAVGNILYSWNYAYNTENVKGTPKTIKDFFNTKKFPGKRAIYKSALTNLEIALAADGIKPGKGGAKIYKALNTDKGVVSTAFCYENTNGCYLYNSSRDNEFNSLNPGIVLNDLIIQGLIRNGKSFFDFLKGTERYKFDLGGKSVQLYDLNLIL